MLCTIVKESARVTEECIEITEATKERLNEKLNMIAEFLSDEPEVTITHFVLDKKKSGGAYITTTGIVKRIDELKHLVIMKDSTKDGTKDGKKIKIPDIYLIDSPLFRPLDSKE